MRDEIHVETVSDPRLLGCIRSLVRAYAAGLGFAEERVRDIVLAVDEACANAIRHSYGGRNDGAVTIVLKSSEEWMELELTDAGAPAPPERIVRRELERPTPETARPGGLGVQLMYEVFDEVRFTPGAVRGNHVIMRLRRPERKDT
ncbi:MAG TPA: ATP-binding protein [Candidatus Hydrogenedentes bacterium]|nr:ATP-binding protein [Candidatus Hydrogenedentota bacterium]HNT87057.1 ATP-binding protein [Candidatus Hydrogenedentota bacterium]